MKMKKKFFLGLFIVLPVLVYVLNLVPRKASSSRIIYYTIPEFHTSMAGSKIGMYLAKRIGSNGRIPVGHAGIIVEEENGDMYEYDYGRFSSCFGTATLPSLKGNWVKRYLGNYKGRSIEELAPEVGENILARFHNSGTKVNFYVMEGNTQDVVDYIEQDANDPDRSRYVWYLDHTCCGRARDAFDRGRTSWLGFCVSKVADIAGNFVPNGSSICQTLFDRNITAIAGVSVEGDSPLINTSRYTYKSARKKVSSRPKGKRRGSRQ